jgi:general stress protein CsbA
VAVDVVKELKDVFLENGDGLKVFTNLLKLATKPLMIMLWVMKHLSPRMIEAFIWFKLINKLLPINVLWRMAELRVQRELAIAMTSGNKLKAADLTLTKLLIPAKIRAIFVGKSATVQKTLETGAVVAAGGAWRFYWVGVTAGAAAVAVALYSLVKLQSPLKILTAILIGAAVAWALYNSSWTLGVASVAIVAGAVAVSAAILGAMPGSTSFDVPTLSGSMSLGSTNYGTASAGSTGSSMNGLLSAQSGLVAATMPQGGRGGSSGVNINIEGDVYDGDNFSEKVSEVLSDALRNADDISAYSVGAAGLSKVVFK